MVYTPLKMNGWNPKSWRFGSNDFPFQTSDFQVNQPLIFQGVHIKQLPRPHHVLNLMVKLWWHISLLINHDVANVFGLTQWMEITSNSISQLGDMIFQSSLALLRFFLHFYFIQTYPSWHLLKCPCQPLSSTTIGCLQIPKVDKSLTQCKKSESFCLPKGISMNLTFRHQIPFLRCFCCHLACKKGL